MVDFNKDTTMTLDKKDINVLTLIEFHYYVLENIELFMKQTYMNQVPVSRPALMSRIYSLFMMARPSLKKLLKKPIYEQLQNLAISKKLEDKLVAFEQMQDFLYSKGVLRYELKNKVDTTNSDDEDTSKGL